MNQFTATHFRFEVEAITPLTFHPYTGSALRGALVSALQEHFCPDSRSETDPAHQAVCPACWLLSHESEKGDSRRPYAIEPLLTGNQAEAVHFEPGQRFQFGLSLFGQAVQLFPYLVLAVPQMGRQGVGLKMQDDQGRWRRGRFALKRIEEVNPLINVRRALLGEGAQMVNTPQHPVTWPQVQTAGRAIAERLTGHDGRLGLHFLTPTRIVRDKKLVHKPEFLPFFQRLLERINRLQQSFGGVSESPPWDDLLALARQAQLVEDRTEWWDVWGHSQRLGRSQTLGGFIGQTRYQASDEVWVGLLPWLIWGMSTHVGKNAVKGSGWYRLWLDE